MSTFMCLWVIYLFPGLVHIFPPAETAAPSWEYIIRSQNMNVEIRTEAPIFLFWEYLLQIFSIFSLQCTALLFKNIWSCFKPPWQHQTMEPIHLFCTEWGEWHLPPHQQLSVQLVSDQRFTTTTVHAGIVFCLIPSRSRSLLSKDNKEEDDILNILDIKWTPSLMLPVAPRPRLMKLPPQLDCLFAWILQIKFFFNLDSRRDTDWFRPLFPMSHSNEKSKKTFWNDMAWRKDWVGGGEAKMTTCRSA